MTRTAKAIIPRALSGSSTDGNWQPPSSIEWMPAGEKTIQCLGPFGLGIECQTVADASDAERLNAQLAELIAKADRGEASRPYIDFDHEEGPAAAIPTRIYWDDGIRVEVEWTSAGREALEGRVYSYFSPSWNIREDGHPDSLPEIGPIGALVNTPAFQDIERLAAKNKAASAAKGEIRMKELIAKLIAVGVIDDKCQDTMTEDEVVAAIAAKSKAAAETSSAEVEKANTEATEAKAKLVEFTKLVAESDVDSAIAAGKLEASAKPDWVSDYVANPVSARKRLASIKVPAQGANVSALGRHAQGGTELTGLQRAIAARKAQMAGK
jgi:hypothetical protein